MNKHVDAIVIGAGAGGGVIAKELACSGMKTVLFERGGWATYDYHPNDELMNQRPHIIGAVHGPDRRKSPYVEVAKDGSIVKSRPDRLDYTIIAACVGSGTVSYGAMAWRFMPQDFRLKSIYGCPEGSTLADWPISYDDLEPFYEKAEWEIGVSGDNSKNPFAPPRKKISLCPHLSSTKRRKLSRRLRSAWASIHSQFQCCAIQCLIMGAPHVFATALVAAMRARWMQRMERKTRLFQKR